MMSTERYIRIMAGTMVLLSLGLSQYAGQVDLTKLSWLWFTAFIGLNLLQSGFTGFCPPEFLLRRLGVKSQGSACSR
ncbi:MAG TPA: DUF2892 domain-containing protein [Rhodocyclaceae bacterium]